MSIDDYKMMNPSEFDEAGNSLVGFSNDRTTLKVYGGKNNPAVWCQSPELSMGQ